MEYSDDPFVKIWWTLTNNSRCGSTAAIANKYIQSDSGDVNFKMFDFNLIIFHFENQITNLFLLSTKNVSNKMTYK